MERHAYSADLCDRLELMAWGEAAAGLIDDIPHAPCAVVYLPPFVWGTPTRRTGRKSKNYRDGSELLLPARVTWSTPSVFLLRDGESAEVTWETEGLVGLPDSGTITLTAVSTDEGAERFSQPFVNIPTTHAIRVKTRPSVRRTLNDTVAGGRHAMWEVLQTLEQNLEWGFRKALASVTAEIGADLQPLDSVTVEGIQNEILYGQSGDRDSLALALVRRCLAAEPFSQVDPQMYIRRWAFSTSESAIRRKIGDPHIGRRIRAVAREINSDDPDEVVAEFSRRNPDLHVGRKRVADALSVQSRTWSISMTLTISGEDLRSTEASL